MKLDQDLDLEEAMWERFAESNANCDHARRLAAKKIGEIWAERTIRKIRRDLSRP